MAAERQPRRILAPVTGLLGGWVDDLRMAGNPYAIRDIRSRVRGLRFPLLLLIYHVIVIGVGLIAVAAYAASANPTTPAGRYVFPSLVYTQLVLAPIVSAVLTATCVSTEREKQTIDLVVMTPMRGVEIALGKLAIPWGLTMMVAITSAPYAVLCMVGGGVNSGSVLLLYLGLAIFCGITATFGLLMSVVSRSSASAVIVTLVVYVICLITGLVGNGLLVQGSFGAGMFGPPNWTFGPYTYLYPTTWASGMLAAGDAQCLAFGRGIPFWLGGVAVWGLLGAYMTMVASCRLSITPPRHLIARRVLGLLTWTALVAIVIGGVWEDLATGSTFSMANLGGYGGGGASMLVIVSTIATMAASVVAMQSGLGDYPDLWCRPFGQVLRRMAVLWKVLSPRPESGLAIGLLGWAAAVAVPFVGNHLVFGSAIPPSLAPGHLLGLLIPQVLCIVFASFAGLWANARFPYATNARRNAAAGRLVPLLAWPIVMAIVFAAIAGPVGARNPEAGYVTSAIGAYVSALSPFSHPVLLGMAGLSTPMAMKAWIEIGPVALHPHMVAALIALGLVIAMLAVAARRWRENARWLQSQGYSMGRLEEQQDHTAVTPAHAVYPTDPSVQKTVTAPAQETPAEPSETEPPGPYSPGSR